MEFANDRLINVRDWKTVEMKHEINPYISRPATDLDSNTSSTTTSITTSLMVSSPELGAGNEYDREKKDSLKQEQERYTNKETNIEDILSLLTTHSLTQQMPKHYYGLKKDDVTTNSSYYVFIEGKDGFEAHRVKDWYAFTRTNIHKAVDDEDEDGDDDDDDEDDDEDEDGDDDEDEDGDDDDNEDDDEDDISDIGLNLKQCI
jgi:hypothetical protein